MTLNVADLRENYTRQRLTKADASPDPFIIFTEWMREALDKENKVHEPNAMALATVNAAGQPAVRMVLLKGFDARGFCFYTNYTSRKAEDMAANPQAALNLWWGPLERQVRVEGHIEKLTAEESDAYYNSRPRGSRLAATLSPQSQVIADRGVLEESLRELEEKYADQEPPRPDYWGGYRVVRSWKMERLAP